MDQDGRQGDESTSDAFAALGLPRRFDLDAAAIDTAFLTRMGGVHPDLNGEEASLDAAALTHAAATLRDPERRAAHLLALLGGPSAIADRSLPDGFLMDMMELRESVEAELAAGGDARARWAAFAEARRAGHIDRVSALFNKAPAGGGAALRDLRVELNAWRYTERLIEQLDPGYQPGRAGA